MNGSSQGETPVSRPSILMSRSTKTLSGLRANSADVHMYSPEVQPFENCSTLISTLLLSESS
jgi:hypothetical protein